VSDKLIDEAEECMRGTPGCGPGGRNQMVRHTTMVDVSKLTPPADGH
jgi:hypothetical protein